MREVDSWIFQYTNKGTKERKRVTNNKTEIVVQTLPLLASVYRCHGKCGIVKKYGYNQFLLNVAEAGCFSELYPNSSNMELADNLRKILGRNRAMFLMCNATFEESEDGVQITIKT